MICPTCKGRLKVSHTYIAGIRGKTQRSQCVKCKQLWTLVTVVMTEQRHGRGAYAISQQLLEGYTCKLELLRDPA